MKINKSAWLAFQSGRTSKQLKESAKAKADIFLAWLLIFSGMLCFLPWEWALAPALVAAFYGAQSFGALQLVPELELIEDILRNTSSS